MVSLTRGFEVAKAWRYTRSDGGTLVFQGVEYQLDPDGILVPQPKKTKDIISWLHSYPHTVLVDIPDPPPPAPKPKAKAKTKTPARAAHTRARKTTR